MLSAAIRCGLGGTVLGLATLAAFAFVGVPTVQVPALLTAADLPPGFAPEPVPPSVGGCAALLADPPAGAVARRYRQARTGATVWEAVVQPAGDVLDDLRASLVTCGLPVEPRGDGFIVDLPDGYLTAAHIGSAVMVLRCAGAGPAVLDTALGKLAP